MGWAGGSVGQSELVRVHGVVPSTELAVPMARLGGRGQPSQQHWGSAAGGLRLGVTGLHPTLAWPDRSRGLLMEGHSEAIDPPSEAAAHMLAAKS